MDSLRVYIGHDPREEIAYKVARESLLKHTEGPVLVEPIKLADMQERGLYWRDTDPLASTAFTYSRFLTPILAGYRGWALFCDCDFLFFSDVNRLRSMMDPQYSVLCVKHDYQPTETTKMDGQQQTQYPRKNWSSFMLINCEHPHVMENLTAHNVNHKSGAYLHRMQWTTDECIGELNYLWNWLEGWYVKPEGRLPNAVHFTRGGPWFEQYRDCDYAAEWLEAARELGFREAVA